MKKSKFTDSQIIDALKRAEAGFAVLALCLELGISSATFYKWRTKYGGMACRRVTASVSVMEVLSCEGRRGVAPCHTRINKQSTLPATRCFRS